MGKIRDFLIPDKFKILIVVIIFGIQMIGFRIYETDPVETNPIMGLIYAVSYPGMVVSYYMNNIDPVLRFLGTPANVIYWYLIACVIVFIGKKIIKKKPSSPSA